MAISNKTSSAVDCKSILVHGLAVEAHERGSLDQDSVSRWRQLEQRSLEGNAFLSPAFVLPAVDCLDQVPPAIFVTVSDTVENNRLLGLGVFEEVRASRLLPLNHLQAWRCDYSLFAGLLIDRDLAQPVARALFEWLRANSRRWHGLAVRDQACDTALAEVIDIAAYENRLDWHEDWTNERAAIDVAQIPSDIMGMYSKSRRKTIKKSQKRLASFGEPSFELRRFGSGFEQCLETFLQLEAMGWKGDEGTAMGSKDEDRQFAIEMAHQFAHDNRLVFGELAINGEVIASTFNLISGDTLFAMKIGWNPQFSDASPGALSELALLESVSSLDGIQHVDSCSNSGSYVEKIWPWRKTLRTGVFTTSGLGNVASGVMQNLKSVKRWLKNLR